MLRVGAMMRRGYGAGSRAAALLAAESNGLAIDFTDLSMVVKDTGTPANNFSGDPNAKLTYAAPSTKYIRNASGVYVPGTTLRCEYDASGNPLGVLVEPQSTNLALVSSNFGDTNSWPVAGLSVTVNSVDGPGGPNTAALVYPLSSGTGRRFNGGQTPTSAVYTASVVAKYAGIPWVYIFKGDGSAIAAWFNLQTGTVGTVGAGYTATIATEANGFFRCSVTSTSAVSGSYLGYFGLSSADNSVSVTANGTAGIHLWHYQLETGSVATSPIITYGSQVTRAADNIYLDASALPSTANEYSVAAFVATAVPSLAAAVATNGSGADGVGNLSLLRFNSQASAAVGGVNSDVFKTFSGDTSGGVKIGGAFRKSDARMAVTAKGQSVATVTTLDWTGAHNRLQFGALNSSGLQSLNGHIQALVLVPRYDESFIIARTA